MGGKVSKIGALVGVAASIGLAGPAQAANPICVGTQQTAGICVLVTPSTLYEDCVYAGPPPCTPVTVPGVDVDCGGWIRDQWVIECA